MRTGSLFVVASIVLGCSAEPSSEPFASSTSGAEGTSSSGTSPVPEGSSATGSTGTGGDSSSGDTSSGETSSGGEAATIPEDLWTTGLAPALVTGPGLLQLPGASAVRRFG